MNSTLRSANNLTKVIVAKGAASHNLLDGDSVAGGLADGVVAVVKPDMTITNTTGELTNTYIANGGLFHIVQGTGVNSPLIVSPLLKNGAYTITRSKYAAATEQVTYVGFNGTTGAIDADTASTSYVVTLIMANPNEKDRSQPSRVYGQYTTPASGATNAISTVALVNNLTKNFSTKADDLVKVEMIVSDAALNTDFSALANPTGAVTFTKGSTTATMTDTASLSAGDWFRIGGVSEAVTDIAYQIKSVDGTANLITLSTPYAGESATISDGLMHLVGANPGDLGIKLSGVSRDFSVTSMRNYYKVRFVVTVGEAFLSTGVTTASKAFEGKGVPAQVAMDYYESMGFLGQMETIGVPPVPRASVPTALTGEYGIMSLAIENPVASIVSQSALKSNLIVYLEYSDGVTGGLESGDVSANGEKIIFTSTTAYDA